MKKIKINDYLTVLCSDTNTHLVDKIELMLNKKYYELIEKLQISYMFHVNVIIHNTLEELHKALNLKSAPNWIVGGSFGNEINVISPFISHKIYSPEDIMKVTIHELTHVFANKICSAKTPKVLLEGLATFEAQQEYLYNAFYEVRMKHNNKILTFEEFYSMDVSDKNLYPYSYRFAEFIIKNYSYNVFISFLKSRRCFFIRGRSLYKCWVESIYK